MKKGSVIEEESQDALHFDQGLFPQICVSDRPKIALTDLSDFTQTLLVPEARYVYHILNRGSSVMKRSQY